MSWYFLNKYGQPPEDKSRGWFAMKLGASILIFAIVLFTILVLLGAK